MVQSQKFFVESHFVGVVVSDITTDDDYCVFDVKIKNANIAIKVLFPKDEMFPLKKGDIVDGKGKLFYIEEEGIENGFFCPAEYIYRIAHENANELVGTELPNEQPKEDQPSMVSSKIQTIIKITKQNSPEIRGNDSDVTIPNFEGDLPLPPPPTPTENVAYKTVTMKNPSNSPAPVTPSNKNSSQTKTATNQRNAGQQQPASTSGFQRQRRFSPKDFNVD